MSDTDVRLRNSANLKEFLDRSDNVDTTYVEHPTKPESNDQSANAEQEEQAEWVDTENADYADYYPEKTYLEYFAEMLGVNVFKKYWPYGGSYWNKHHIDSTDRCQLLGLIQSGKSNIRSYFLSMFLILQSVFFSYACAWEYRRSTHPIAIKVLLISAVYFGYGWLVQTYNIRKAKRALAALPKPTVMTCPMGRNYVFDNGLNNKVTANSTTNKVDPLRDTNFQLSTVSESIYNYWHDNPVDNGDNKLKLWRIKVRWYNISVGPYFTSEESALEYALRLVSIPLQDIFNQYAITINTSNDDKLKISTDNTEEPAIVPFQ